MASPGLVATQQPSKETRKERWSKMPAESSPGFVLRVQHSLSAVWCLRGVRQLHHPRLHGMLLPVAAPGSTGYSLPCRRPVRIRRRGCIPENLRPVQHASQQTDLSLVRVALINTRSVVNKTFILNDFFISHSLDFLLLTETWLKPGDNSVFSELLPPSCSFFSSPRASGRGGGLLLCSRTVLNAGVFLQMHTPLLNCNCL